MSGYMIQVSLLSGSEMAGMKGLSLKINGSEYIGRPDNKDAPTKFSFSLPKLEEGQTVSLKTPQFFNGVLKADIKALSQGENGDVAMSQTPVTMTVDIAAEADGVTVTTLDNAAPGVEDSQTGVKIPARIARNDKSESLSEVKVTATTSGTVDDVVYLTRFEMLKTGVTDLSSATGLYDVADLEVKGDGTYVIASGAQTFDAGSLAKAAFRVQIAGDIGKTIPTNIGDLRSVAEIETTLTSAGFTKGTDYIYVLEGATSGGRKIVSAVDWDGG